MTTTATTRGVKKATAVKPVGKGSVAVARKTLKVPQLLRVAKTSGKKMALAGAAYPPSSIINIITGSPEDVIMRTREGLPSSVLGDISVYLDMPQKQLYDAVGVSRSTIAARIKGNQPLSSAESDKVVRIAKVLKRASEVLDDKEQARIWLRREIRSIGGVPPITMLDTEAGYELILDTLGRIEQGIAA